MNLKELKGLVLEYEDALEKLRCLRDAQAKKVEWVVTSPSNDITMYLPPQYAAKMVQDRILAVEEQAKEVAGLIGLTFALEK